MPTDMRPIVERLLRKLVIAGLPLVASCSSTGGVDGEGGSGGGGGGGEAVTCQPFSLTCGERSICPSIAPDGGPSTGTPISLTTSMMDFSPSDERWAALYRACIFSGPACGPDCTGLCSAVARANGAGYIAPGYVECEVTCGDPNRMRMAYVSGVCGRRPAGASGCRPTCTGTPVARYLVEAAALEAASVPAFARLARDLAAHGAPARLVRAARTAMADEARHWRRTRDVARRRGGDPVRTTVSPAPVASLEEIAVDNVVEGCVRETFGALIAAHQAAAAGDREIRALMTDIAEDELSHASLSWQIDAWACDQLGTAFRARRSQVARAAVGELVLAAGASVAEELRIDAGLPGPDDARALLVAVWETTWQPLLA
jgi:hypothetical protein